MLSELSGGELQKITNKKLDLERKQVSNREFISEHLKNIGIPLCFSEIDFLAPHGLETVPEGEPAMDGLIIELSLNQNPAQDYSPEFRQHALYKACCDKKRKRENKLECLFVILAHSANCWQVIEFELYPLSDWLKKVESFKTKNGGSIPTSCCNSFHDFAEGVWPTSERGTSTIVLFLEKLAEVDHRHDQIIYESLATFVESMTFTGYAGPDVAPHAPPKAAGGGSRPPASARPAAQPSTAAAPAKKARRATDSSVQVDVVGHCRAVSDRLRVVGKSPEERLKESRAIIIADLEDPSNGFFGLDLPQNLIEGILRHITDQFRSSRNTEAKLLSYLAEQRLEKVMKGDNSSLKEESHAHQTAEAMRAFARRHHVETTQHGDLADEIVQKYRFCPIAHIALNMIEALWRLIQEMAPHMVPHSFAAAVRNYTLGDFLQAFSTLRDDDWGPDPPAGGDDGPMQRQLAVKFVLQFLHTCTWCFKSIFESGLKVDKLIKLVKLYLKFCTDPFVYRFACNPDVFKFIQDARFDYDSELCPCQRLLNEAMEEYQATPTAFHGEYGLWKIPMDIAKAMQALLGDD